jgi:acyl-CoA synthetase (AMP-forming)/AMP-acid ligase II
MGGELERLTFGATVSRVDATAEVEAVREVDGRVAGVLLSERQRTRPLEPRRLVLLVGKVPVAHRAAPLAALGSILDGLGDRRLGQRLAPRERQAGEALLRKEEVLACIVPMPAAKVGAALAEALFEHCNARLAYFKAPGWVLFLDRLPTTGTQKAQKSRIFATGEDPRCPAP